MLPQRVVLILAVFVAITGAAQAAGPLQGEHRLLISLEAEPEVAAAEVLVLPLGTVRIELVYTERFNVGERYRPGSVRGVVPRRDVELSAWVELPPVELGVGTIVFERHRPAYWLMAAWPW